MSMTLSSSTAATLVGNSKDLVCEILSRLPWYSVILFRLVCKEWCSLLSTQSFIDMHGNINQTSVCLVLQYFNSDATTSKSDHFNTLFFISGNKSSYMKSVTESINLSSNFSLQGGGEKEKEGKIYYQQQRTNTNFFSEKKCYHIKLISSSSCRGFLVYTAKPAAPANMSMSMSTRFRRWLTKDEEKEEEDPALILYNPITKEQHTVTAPPSTHVYCGCYYHSPTKEHRILYQLMFDDDDHQAGVGVVKFLVFGLQTKSTRVLELKVNKDDYYHIDTSTPPVISNGSLHWIVSEDNRQIPSYCSQSILSFGIESEELHTMPHPPLSHTCSRRYSRRTHKFLSCHEMNLLEMESAAAAGGGILCLCDGFMKLILEIYVMEDYKEWIWTRRYRIDFTDYISYETHAYGLNRYFECKALKIGTGDQLLLHFHRASAVKQEEEYAIYHLNEHKDGRALYYRPSIEDAPTSLLSCITPFEVRADVYPNDQRKGKLMTRIIIKSDKKKKNRPLLVVGDNMVVFTPTLASLHHNGSAPPRIRTFFSIRTNRSYEYI